MNKTELIREIANKAGFTQKDVAVMVDAMVDTVVETVTAGDEVKISGLGKFYAAEVAERTGTIQLGDKKGESYVSPAHNAPRFKAASAFKDAVRA